MRKKTSKPIYTLDAETDPFRYGRIPMPFTWCVWRGWYAHGKLVKGEGIEHVTKGKNCTAEMVEYLATLPAGIIYAHNGGKFDIFYMLEYINKDKRIKITNNRILSCYIPAANGEYHEIRDSYKIFPAPLESYRKDNGGEDFYAMFEEDVRDLHEDVIRKYLISDCEYLHRIVSRFIDEFGSHLTIGSAAIKHLKMFHDIGEELTWQQDRDIRQHYYYGGRVECFEQGLIQQNMQYIDVNSMYPYVMAHYDHPKGYPEPENKRVISDDTFFVTVEGENRNALPMRMKDGSISFKVRYGVFHCTIHEYKEAVSLGLFVPHNIIRTVDFKERIRFTEYVYHYYALRQQATDAMKICVEGSEEWFEHKLNKDLYKNLLNNSYGKFAINPDNQFDYEITAADDRLFGFIDGEMCNGDCPIVDDFGDRHYLCEGWHECMYWGKGKVLWKKPSSYARVMHVGIGASITGAARAYLMRWIAAAEQPLYCDTDSLIFSGSTNAMPLHGSKLGALKVEHADLDEAALCGKKLYAVWAKGVCKKIAAKGGKLTAEQMREIAAGGEATTYNAAPTNSLSGKVCFQKRTFRSTKPCEIVAQ